MITQQEAKLKPKTKYTIAGISALMKVIYFFLVGLISVLLAVLCAFIVVIARKPNRASMERRFRKRGPKNRIFSRKISAKEPSLIMSNKSTMGFIEDM
jgi:hypothetical protein